MDFNYLAGEIPKEIGNLVNLSKFLGGVNWIAEVNSSNKHPDNISHLSDSCEFTCLVELRLNDNSFTGKIPGQIANLDNLVMLALENNGLTGDLPKNVCSLSNLAVIRLDCDAIGCDCCTGCSAGPPDPMTSPTSSPTIPATASPTVCSDAVNVFSTCFAVGDDIIASFSNCNPEVDDWVGLFPSTENFSDLPNPSIWSWACGSRNCREAVTSNTIALNADLAGNSDWPPAEGTYRVVIARNSAQPYAAFAVSGEFTIASSC